MDADRVDGDTCEGGGDRGGDAGRVVRHEARDDALMSCIVGGLEEFQSRYQELLRAHDALKEEHEQLQRTYDEERECWRRFKQWWQGQQDVKRRTKSSISSPLPTPTSAPLFRTPAARAGPQSCSKFTADDVTVLRSVGLMPNGEKCPDEGLYTPSKCAVPSSPQRGPLALESALPEACGAIQTDSGKRAPLLPKSLNSEYEVDPAKNGDRPFLHKSVERNKAKRKQMHAFDCQCCKDWYDAVGPVAVRPFEEICETRCDAREDGDTAAEQKRQQHLQRTSRHRDHGPPPSTPPGYWDIGFPNTQRIEVLNRTADEADRRRRELIARDPRFKRRSDVGQR